MTIAKVLGPTAAFASANTVTTTFTGDPAEGNLLISIVRQNAGTLDGATVTGFTKAIKANATSTGDVLIFYKVAGAGESRDVVAACTNATSMGQIIFEWSGIASAVLDKTASSNYTGAVSSKTSGTTDATTADSELCMAAFGLGNTTTSQSFSNSYTDEYSVDAATVHAASLVQVAAGAQETTESWTTARYAGGCIATFKAGGATSTPMTLTGGNTPGGVLVHSYGTTKTGGDTPGGVLAHSLIRTLTGGDTPGGTLVKVLTLNRTLAGGMTPGGVLAKVLTILRTFTGGGTPGGVLGYSKSYLRTLAGGITPAGPAGYIWSIAETLQGAITPGGTLGKVLTILRTFTGGDTPAGALSYYRGVVMSFVGALVPDGVMSKLLTINRTLAGALTPGGVLGKILTILRTFTGGDTPGGALSYFKAFVRTLTGDITPGGTLAKALTILRTLTGAVTSAGELIKAIPRTLAGAIAQAGTLGQAFIPGGTITPMTLIGSIAPAGALINYLTTALVRWHKWRMRDHRFDKPKVWNRKR